MLFPAPFAPLLLAVLGILFWHGSTAAMAFDQEHKLLTKELKKYLHKDGLVDYAQWKQKQEGLKKYLQNLAELKEDEYKKFSRLEKRTLWLNAYNALAIKLVLDHYPINGKRTDYPAKSIRQIPETWDAIKSRIAGQEVSLYSIVHDKLRKARDPRTHFALVPASRGGGVLKRTAYKAGTVLADLESVTQEFMRKKENLFFDEKENALKVSMIFKWFPLDFLMTSPQTSSGFEVPADDQVVKEYVKQFLPDEIRQRASDKSVRVIYLPYDWSLNDAQG